MGHARAFFFTPILLISAFLAGHALTVGAQARSDDDRRARAVTPRPPLSSDELSVIETYEAAAPCVVFIDTVSEVTRRDFFNRRFTQRYEGSGSGFVWDRDGHVVTNHHVVDGATFITVTLASGQTYEAQVVGQAADEDLAVLKIDAPAGELVPIPIGTSHDLRVGQRVLAIGNPFGLDQTLTVGFLSAVGRTIESRSGDTIYDVLQTDAAINPGNSGGPLLDSAGRLIGVNTAIRSATRSSAGIGFAVPVDRVNTIVPQLIAGRMGPLPSIGFSIIAPSYAQRWGVERGVLIGEVRDGTPASRAGLRSTSVDRMRRVTLGDVLIGLGGERVDDSADLLRVLGAFNPGDRVELEILRDDQRLSVEIELDEPVRRR
ncbi:MAG: trypsin-like peptidase domain-containing protein [Phycisphaerales bacterium]